MSEITEKIRSRGYWEVAIRPEPFEENRTGYGELLDLLSKVAVRMRGWPVPYIDFGEEPVRGDNWIGQDVDAEMVSHHEAWRFFTSGQFIHLRAVSADWRDVPVPDGYSAVIEVWEILFYLTEVFELASRLALSPAGGDHIEIDVRLNGLENRGLIVADQGRSEFFEPKRCHLSSLERSLDVPREALVADPNGKAVEMALDMFQRFGWNTDAALLSEYQRDLTERD